MATNTEPLQHAQPTTTNTKTNTPTVIQQQHSSPDVADMIDRLEVALTNLVKGLCSDINNSNTNRIASQLDAANRDNKCLQTELSNTKKQCQQFEKAIKEQSPLEHPPNKCECDAIMQDMASKSLAIELQLEDTNKQMTSQDATIMELQAEVSKKCTKLDSLSSSLQQAKEAEEALQSQLTSANAALEESKAMARSLELQLSAPIDSTPFTQVPEEPVIVKGEGNPLSNFYPCKIHAFGQEFNSVEHGWHVKKAWDKNNFKAADAIKAAPTAQHAKAEADNLLGKSHAWEEKSLTAMEYLLSIKAESCPEFKRRLLATKSRHIVHTVHSTFWGTGGSTTGDGQNKFGHLLMDLRKQLAAEQPSPSPTSNSRAPSTSAPTSLPKSNYKPNRQSPHVMLVGNSLLKGVRADKLSHAFTAENVPAYTITEAKTFIENITTHPQAVAFQLTTNDVRADISTSDIANQYKELIDTTQKNLPNTKIVISQAPRRRDSTRLNARANAVNALVQDTLPVSRAIASCAIDCTLSTTNTQFS
jgi:ribA/ribD-fused uncharacterized protein